MKLVAVPRSMPPHTHFGKPLRAHRECPFVTGSGYYFGKLVVELNAELNGFSRSDCSRKLHQRDCPVIRVVVVWRDEFELICQISLTSDFKLLDVNRPKVARLPFLVGKITVGLACEG